MSPELIQRLEKLHDDQITANGMWPFWVFADLIHQGKFWCFIGEHYPFDLVSDPNDKQAYEIALNYLGTGKWKADAMEARKTSYIGYGCADTPSVAFIRACRMAGYAKAEL